MAVMQDLTKERLKKIEHVLKKNPDGMWIWEIARELGVKSGSAEWLLNRYLKNFVERRPFNKAKSKRKKPYIVFIRWKT